MEPFETHPLNQPPRKWNWKYISLWIVIGIEFFFIIAIAGANSGTTTGPYNKACHETMYDESVGYDRTAYFPCTNEVP